MERPVLAIDGIEIEVPRPGHNLAPAAFTAPQVYAFEQHAIFGKSWVHVCDLIDLPDPGSYFAAQIGATPVLILRDRASGQLRGYLNACRHRGAQLLEGKGVCEKQIKCPYHAWSYGLDGKLLGVPYRDELAHADLDAFGLIAIRVDSVGPLVFACLDPAAPSLAEWVGELPASLARTGAAAWPLAYERTHDVAANWKLFVENANDGYHVPVVHDILTDILVADSGITTLEPHSAFTWAKMNPAYIPPGGDPNTQIRFGCIFPNLIPVLSPADLTYLRVDPIANDQLRLVVRSYDHPDFQQLREFRKMASLRTTEQDIAVVLRVQRGLQAQGLPAGVHTTRLEERIGHFERMWATAIGDALAQRERAALTPPTADCQLRSEPLARRVLPRV